MNLATKDKLISDALVRCVSLLNDLHVLGRDIPVILTLRDCLQAIAEAHGTPIEEVEEPKGGEDVPSDPSK
jgi:hypothetical protein